MRWNGVFILGLGLMAAGFGGLLWQHVFPGPTDSAPRAMALFISVFAAGTLAACLGTLIGRRRTQFNRRPQKARFSGRTSGNGTRTRNFGQRAEYSALGKQSPAAPKPPAPPVALLTFRRPE